MPKMARFMLMMWAAFLARLKPVSTRANPACMNTTSAAPMHDPQQVDLLAEDDHVVAHSASPPRSPVRMRRALATSTTQTLPSPILPVWPGGGDGLDHVVAGVESA